MRGRWSARRTVVAIAALVVLDLVLVALAFVTVRPRNVAGQREDVSGAAAATAPAPARGSAGTTSRTSPSSGGSPSSSGAPASSDPTPTVTLLAAMSGDIAWRGTRGSCDGGGGAVSMTQDGGRTWSAASSPSRVVMRLVPRDEHSATVVGAGADCAAALFATSSAGAAWTGSGSANERWYRDPQDRTRVHTPRGNDVQPCDGQAFVVDFASLSTATAQALCSEGEVRITADGGGSWQRTSLVPGGLALDARREAAGVVAYVLRVDATCPGLQLTRAGATVDAVGCLTGASAPSPGALALSVNGDNGWVEAADQTWRSTDGLRTWTRAS